jgi:Pin2-interacting protein X1
MAYYTSLSGKKLRAKLVGTLNESASAPTSEFAKKQLEKMGWSEGKGLGKHEQGIQTHIKVKKREVDVGLGHNIHGNNNNNNSSSLWWADACGDTLSRLSKKPKRVMTDEELFDATGGARFGMRAQRKQTGKWSRAETKDPQAEEDAKTKVEWNGTGEAKVILSSSSEDKKEPTTTIDNDDESPKLKKVTREREKSDGQDMEQPKKRKKVKPTINSSEDEERRKKKKKKTKCEPKRNEESEVSGDTLKKIKKEKKTKKRNETKRIISNE